MSSVPDLFVPKIERAEFHIRGLDKEVTPLMDLYSESVWRQVESEGAEYSFYLGAVPPMPTQWIPAVGDVLHNLRSSLDHLAWMLAKKPSEGTVFPILDKPGSSKPVYLVGGVKKPETLDLINEVQPYQRWETAEDAWNDELWLLHRLNIIDKHRRLLLAVVAVHSLTHLSESPALDAAPIFLESGSVEAGAKVVAFRSPSNPNLSFHPYVAFDVRIKERERIGYYVQSLRLTELLQRLTERTKWVLNQFVAVL